MARKQNSAKNVVDAVKASDDKDRQAQQKHLEALQTLPSPVFTENIPFDKVKTDKDFNVRDEDSYSFESNRELYDSLVNLGLIKRDPMSFSRQKDGTFKVLAGHLRMDMMRIHREKVRTEAQNAGKTLKELPFDMIFGMVYDGLDINQEHLIMADHIMRKPLNEFELAKEVGEFMFRYPITDERAGIHFGMNKSKIQRLRQLYSMPTALAEKRKEKANEKDVPFIKIGQAELKSLYSAYTLDQQAGCKPREEGPNFQALWKSLEENPNLLKVGGQQKTDPRQEAAVVEKQSSTLTPLYGNTPEILAVQGVLAWAIGIEGTNLSKTVQDLKAYCDDLREKSGIGKPKGKADHRVKK